MTTGLKKPDNPKPLPAWPIDWDRLKQDHELAFLRGDLAASSPESYTVEEMKAIGDGMFASTAEVEAAMRTDFENMPSFAQDKMLSLLKRVDPINFDWWRNLLVRKMPSDPDKILLSE